MKFNAFKSNLSKVSADAIVVPANEVEAALEILRSHGEDAYVIGSIIKNEEKVILE